MKIALDYDGTYTVDPHFWLHFIAMARHAGHEVHVVTMRYPGEKVAEALSLAVAGRVHYTAGQFKQPHMLRKGLHMEVWIDDSPGMVTGGGDVLQWDDHPTP